MPSQLLKRARARRTRAEAAADNPAMVLAIILGCYLMVDGAPPGDRERDEAPPGWRPGKGRGASGLAPGKRTGRLRAGARVRDAAVSATRPGQAVAVAETAGGAGSARKVRGGGTEALRGTGGRRHRDGRSVTET